ncbi:hypothetical protein GGC64_005806 [Mycobacterium sp. OAS707]|nr:hypothetical protein [Mycobacterium sp. OAS707]
MWNTLSLENMSWSSWGSQGADGTGTAVLNTCENDCADGPYIKNPIVVHATDAKPAPDARCPGNLLFYTDIVLAFPQSLPPPKYLPANTTRYMGMTAIHNPRDIGPDCQTAG